MTWPQALVIAAAVMLAPHCRINHALGYAVAMLIGAVYLLVR